MKSGRNPRRKLVGPLGKMMYNNLEKQTLSVMLQAGMDVEYEPVVVVGDRRIVPDFRMGKVYVECTGDPKANVKAERFREKIRLLRKYYGRVRVIVVTLPYLVERYKLYLGRRATVTTTEKLADKLGSH